jgi:hypothetical protein
MQSRSPEVVGVGSQRVRVPPLQYDVYHLILRFLVRTKSGLPPAFDVFKQGWKEMHFSNIFEVSGLFV